MAPPGAGAARWQYEVAADEGAEELRIEAWLPRGSLADLVVQHGAARFIDHVEVDGPAGWHGVPAADDGFHAPECARGCRLRYRFALRRAARELHDPDGAIAWGGVVEASPSAWLLHPTLAPAGARYRFHVSGAPGVAFVTGVFAADDAGPDTYEADASNLVAAPYAAFGDMRVRRLSIGAGAALDVAIAPGRYVATDDDIADWAARTATTMGRYLGCFPVERAMVLVVPAPGDDVRDGQTMGDGGASIIVEVGESADPAALAHDWVLPHEMAHLALPSLARRHHWMEEGVAVYLQPIARARAGELTPEEVWGQFAAGMPQGVPARGDRGLDETHGWGRTYWGGATFCLLADLEIRRRTANRFGFEDALRGILASGGSVATIWDFDRVVDAGDSWVGVPALWSLRKEMADEPWTVDLSRLFRSLGVVARDDGRVELDDAAPLADLRRAITEPLPKDAPPPVACRWATRELALARLAAR